MAGWLGVSDADAVLEAEGLSAEYEQGRVQGLGLGAKFLPHHKARAAGCGGCSRAAGCCVWMRSQRVGRGAARRALHIVAAATRASATIILLTSCAPRCLLVALPQAVALTAGVEHRLSSKLKRTAERQAAAAGGGAPAGRHHGGAHQHPGAAKHAALLQHGRHHAAGRGQDKAAPPAEQQRQRQQAGSEEEEDSEAEEGRGRAFGKGKGKAAARPAILSRGDLLKVSGLPGKKRKRKSGGGSGAAGS